MGLVANPEYKNVRKFNELVMKKMKILKCFQEFQKFGADCMF